MARIKPKSPRKLERHFKGVANHHRIQILYLIDERPNITLEEIFTTLKGNQKTYSEHTRRLVIAGLVEKSYLGRMVQHNLTPYGQIFLDFIQKFARTPDDETRPPATIS
jgi:DNA-binding transcriptional ArsR family regulator